MKKKYLLMISLLILTGCSTNNSETTSSSSFISEDSSSTITSNSELTEEEKQAIKDTWLLAVYRSNSLDGVYEYVWGQFDYAGFAIENTFPEFTISYALETMYRYNIEGYEYAMPCSLCIEFYQNDTLKYVISFNNLYGSFFRDLDNFNANDYEITYDVIEENGDDPTHEGTTYNNLHIYINDICIASQEQYIMANYFCDARNEVDNISEFVQSIKDNLRFTKFNIGDKYQN